MIYKRLFSLLLPMIYFTFLGACTREIKDGRVQPTIGNIEELALPFAITTDNCARCSGKDAQDIYVATIIEPRALPRLISITLAVIKQLPKNWIIQIYHGTENEDFLRNDPNIEPLIDSGKVVLSRMQIDNLTIEYYNRLLLSVAFWKTALGENILTFETDSVACSGATSTINDFTGYDYIGAPWPIDYGCYIFRDKKNGMSHAVLRWDTEILDKYKASADYDFIAQYDTRIGNSGFSFKKKSKIINLLEKYIPVSPLYVNRASDLFIGCAALDPAAQMKVPTVEVAKRFSVEGVYYPTPFAVHKPWWSFRLPQLDMLAVGCPELNTILRPAYINNHNPDDPDLTKGWVSP